VSVFATPALASLLGEIVTEIMISASMFVNASVFQLFFNLL